MDGRKGDEEGDEIGHSEDCSFVYEVFKGSSFIHFENETACIDKGCDLQNMSHFCFGFCCKIPPCLTFSICLNGIELVFTLGHALACNMSHCGDEKTADLLRSETLNP